MQLAPTISLSASGNIAVHFYHSETSLHTVEIPHNLNGMRLLHQILKARDQHETRLGELGNPTQAIVDAWLKNKKVQDEQDRAEREKKEHAEFMEDWEQECLGTING